MSSKGKSKKQGCNHCTFLGIQAVARHRGLELTMMDNPQGGKDVFIHPHNTKISKSNTPNQQKPYWRAWFGLIPEECTCEP